MRKVLVFLCCLSGACTLTPQEKAEKAVFKELVIKARRPSHVAFDPAFINTLTDQNTYKIGRVPRGEKSRPDSKWRTNTGDVANDFLIVEGILAPNIMVSPEEYLLTVVFTMETQLRLWAGGSSPVASPGFKPEVTLNWFKFTSLGDYIHAGLGQYLTPLNLGISAGHYSNGQIQDIVNECDGNDASCRPQINHLNGSFGSDYFFSAHLDYFFLFGEGDLSSRYNTEKKALLLKLEVEWHPTVNQDRQLDSLGHYYPEWHVKSENKFLMDNFGIFLDLAWYPGAASTNLSTLPNPSSFAINAKVSFDIMQLGFGRQSDVDLFVGYHFGRDYYNAWMDRDMRVFQVGLITSIGSDQSTASPESTGREKFIEAK